VKKFPRTAVAIFVIAVSALAVAAATSASTKKVSAGAEVAVLLPDTQSSKRWETADRPFLAAAFKKAGLTYNIVNAQGSATTQQTQAEQAITNGAKVILLVNLDSGSGAAIEKNAKSHGVKVIDYDRLTLKGSASYYVSFNNVKVGQLQGQGLVNCLKASGKYSQHPVVAELNGGQEDANSFLFKGGYDSVLKPLYANKTLTKGPDQFVPAWDNQKAGTIFEQMLVKTSNKIDAVAAANDGLANAVVVSLKAHKLKPIPLSGQDATPLGVQNIISGWQTMTVYKDVRKLATVAAKAAVQIVKGQALTTTGTIKTKGRGPEPTILIAPQSITKSNYKLLFTSGFLKKSDVCNGTYAKYCK
jgi:D-xylose transport system substrate-binding protein